MSKLSPHFFRSEFSCKCGCGYDTVDVELIPIAEQIRDFIGAYSPSSACRCAKHNALVGGRPSSKHLIGRAIDVQTSDPKKLFNFLDNLFPNAYGIGLYTWGVHIDTREKKARWGNH